jgi:hypothetical protein
MHLPTRDELVGKLLAALRPGGWLLIEDGDSAPLSAAGGAYRLIWDTTVATFSPAGVDYDWGRRVPGRMAAAGCVDVGASLEAPIFRGGTPAAELFQLSWIQTIDQLRAAGLAEHVLKEGLAELGDPDRWFPSLGIVSAWGRRPA